MRNRFDRQLQVLNDELIEMGSLIEQAIEMASSMYSYVRLASIDVQLDRDITMYS